MKPNTHSSSLFVEIATIVVMSSIAKSTGETVWNGFTASWDQDTSTHFYTLPETLKSAKAEGWNCISGVNPPEGITALSYNDDPTFAILFKKGKAIGFQIAILVSDIQNSGQPLKYDELDAIITKTINGKIYYTATTYFVNDESTGIRRIWFQEKNRRYEIPTQASLVPSQTQFELNKCVPAMGTHYYAWNSTSNCTTLYPWLLLAVKDNVIGVGFQGFGIASTLGIRKWWEVIPDNSIYAAITYPPPCAVEAIKKYGIISLHVWFLDKPKNITCSS